MKWWEFKDCFKKKKFLKIVGERRWEMGLSGTIIFVQIMVLISDAGRYPLASHNSPK